MHFGSHARSSVCALKPRLICARVLMLLSLGAGALERRCAQAQMLYAQSQAFKVLPKHSFKSNFQWNSCIYQIKT
jgi:hypothetical protein